MSSSLSGRHAESLRLLMRAVAGQAKTFRFLIATFGDSVYRDEVIRRINRGTPRGSAVVSAAGLDVHGLEQRLMQMAESASLIHVVETHALVDERERWMSRLNYAREELASRCPASVIVWLYDDEASEFARRAPDLWAWRRGVYEFVGGDDGEQTGDEERLIEAFAEVFSNRDEAVALVNRAGFPKSWMPRFETSVVFWHMVAEEARQGALKGGLSPIVERAAKIYPRHPVFARHARQIEGSKEAQGASEVSRSPGDEESAVRGRPEMVASGEVTVTPDVPRPEGPRGDAVVRGDSGSESRMVSARERGVRLVAEHDYDGARAAFDEALGEARKLADDRAVGQILGLIGWTSEAQGDLQAALKEFQESVLILEKAGDVRSHSVAVGDVARVLQLQGAYDRAYALYEEVLATFVEIGELREQAIVLAGMARIHVQRGEIEDAQRRYEWALQLTEEVGDRLGRAVLLGEMARLILRRGDVERALEIQEEQRREFSKLGDVREEAVVLGDLARIYRSRGEIDRALALDQARLEIYQTIGNKIGVANALWTMGRDRARKDEAEALVLLEEAYQICVEVGLREGIVTVGRDLGQVLVSAGRLQVARSVLENVQDILRSLGREGDAKDVLSVLDDL